MPVRLISQEELPGPLKGYRLVERLGRGGFGEVWKVEAPGGLLKAAKFVFGDLDSADEDGRPAEQELKALHRVKSIRHPYILSLERFEPVDGQLIIIMELADRNLWDRFRECKSQGLGGIPREELLRYMEEAAEALDLMNDHYQIQHLDIKPQNLFLLYNHVKVADFGLAKMFEGCRGTITGGVTPVYAAPETFEGWVSRFTDQYSLAIVFQELLTGTRPFTGANTRQLLMQHINGTPDMSQLSSADQLVIGRGLAKKSDERWASCTEMVRALRAAGQPATASLVSTPAPLDQASAPRANQQLPYGSRPGAESSINTKAQTPRPSYEALPPNYQGARRSDSPSGSGSSTPMPPLVTAGPQGLVTPKLVAPSVGSNPALTLQRPQVFQTGRMGTLGVAPPEKIGDGALFPTLVIGVGGTGRAVLQQLRQVIGEHYGSPERVPNVRFLYVDTDPEAGTASSAIPDGDSGLIQKDVLVARLNRPAHYMQHGQMPSVETWMPPGCLYKLPRTPSGTEGVRAFGRLALCDHYRLIVQRLRQEIETFLTDESLGQADKATRLGMRSNRPRTYLVAGLGGGTGGGMFIDLAFLIRHELRQVGYMRPEVVGLFFVPPADRGSSRSSVLGNAHAALTELHHFQARKSRYQMAFDKTEAPVVDSEAPFARVAILSLPSTPGSKAQVAETGKAARAIYHEILTPAGRVVDEVRDVYRNAFPSTAPTCQTFGLFRLSWPRAEVLTAATRRFAQRLIQRWMAKEATHLREPIAQWVVQQWEARRLAFEPMTAVFQTAARDALREEPEKVFDAFTDSLRTRTPSSNKVDVTAACNALDQLLKLVGKPQSESEQEPGLLLPALATRYTTVAKEAERELAFMAVQFIEQPQFRLAGAEEAVRQIADRLREQVEVLEPMQADLEKEVRGQYSRLLQAIAGLNSSGKLTGIVNWKSSIVSDLHDLLRSYPRKRLQLHVLDMALSVYRKLQGSTPEILREIAFCRTTLADQHATLAKAASAAGPPVGPGKLVLPDGCKDLDQAADLFLANLTPEDLLAFDQAFQKDTQKKFRGLATVCLKPNDKAARFRELLLTKAREFLDSRLDRADPAAVFLHYHNGQATGNPLIAEAFDEAAPGLVCRSGKTPDEMIILAAPAGENGDQFREVAAQVLPEVEFTPAPLPDDIVYYREHPRLDLADLPQLGNTGREAYQALLAADHPPHARTDIVWQLPTVTV